MGQITAFRISSQPACLVLNYSTEYWSQVFWIKPSKILFWVNLERTATETILHSSELSGRLEVKSCFLLFLKSLKSRSLESVGQKQSFVFSLWLQTLRLLTPDLIMDCLVVSQFEKGFTAEAQRAQRIRREKRSLCVISASSPVFGGELFGEYLFSNLKLTHYRLFTVLDFCGQWLVK